MNIELLQEIRSLLKDGKSLTDISSEVSLPKSSITLMLRIEDIVKKEYINISRDFDTKLNLLKSENDVLEQKNNKFISVIDLLKLENESLKHPFIKVPLEIPNCSKLRDNFNELDIEVLDLKDEIKDLKNSLNSIPIFIRMFFSKDELY